MPDELKRDGESRYEGGDLKRWFSGCLRRVRNRWIGDEWALDVGQRDWSGRSVSHGPERGASRYHIWTVRSRDRDLHAVQNLERVYVGCLGVTLSGPKHTKQRHFMRL